MRVFEEESGSAMKDGKSMSKLNGRRFPRLVAGISQQPNLTRLHGSNLNIEVLRYIVRS